MKRKRQHRGWIDGTVNVATLDFVLSNVMVRQVYGVNALTQFLVNCMMLCLFYFEAVTQLGNVALRRTSRFANLCIYSRGA